MHPVQLPFGTHCLLCFVSAQVLQYSCVMLHPEEELEEEEEAGGVQSSIGGGVSQDVHSLLGEHDPYGIHSEQSKLHPELEEELDELDDELLAGQAA